MTLGPPVLSLSLSIASTEDFDSRRLGIAHLALTMFPGESKAEISWSSGNRELPLHMERECEATQHPTICHRCHLLIDEAVAENSS